VAIPQTALVVSGPFGDGLSGAEVARAIARGLVAGGRPDPDLCPLDAEEPTQADGSGRAATERVRETRDALVPDVATLLAGLDFDARMRRARAVVLAEAHLRERTLRGSVAFEIATRARQGGVPAYAVTGRNALTPFDARILDLQVIFEAGDKRALAGAGRKLAGLI
jgi:Glycerate kinase family